MLVVVVLVCVLLPAPALAAVSVGVRVADHERTLPQLSAVTVAQDTALQTRLGAQLARHLAGATTGYQRLDELSMNLHERRLKLYDRLGMGPLRVELVWPDRSRTVYTMDGNSNRRAAYLTGESRDPHGNPLPDQSAAQRAGAVSLVGWYQFQTVRSRQAWVRAARAQGIPVQDDTSSATRMQCRWSGTALSCHTE
ncbi:hypothetical protein [Stenotrophomonas bentonitica]